METDYLLDFFSTVKPTRLSCSAGPPPGERGRRPGRSRLGRWARAWRPAGPGTEGSPGPCLSPHESSCVPEDERGRNFHVCHFCVL